MPDALIVAAVRSPIGKAFKGSLVDVRPDDLTAAVVQAALDRVPQLDPGRVDDLYLGCGEPYDEQGANIARRVAVLLGLDQVPGATVNRFCASSLQAIRMGYHAIKAEEGNVFIAAGVECVSRYADPSTAGRGPEHCFNPRFAEAQTRSERASKRNERWTDPRAHGWLPDIYIAMGQTAENIALICGISREEQDEFALRSQLLVEKAIAKGLHSQDVVPIALPDGAIMSADDSPRPGTTYEKLAALEPVFRPDGSVTAGNCCPLNDGAAAVVVMSDDCARELDVTPLARIRATGVSALSPEIMGLGPVDASRRALARAGMTIDDVDIAEINEAFAAQVIPSYRQLGIDVDRLNVHGGAIALGHPFGMTGARIATTLISALRARDKEIGLETMCVGGGQGMAMVVERLS